MIAAVAAAVVHAAQANPRHVNAGAAKLGVFHRHSVTPLPVDDVTQRPTATIGVEMVAELCATELLEAYRAYYPPSVMSSGAVTFGTNW